MTLPTVLTLRNYVVSALPELADQVDRLISESFALGLKVGTKPRPREFKAAAGGGGPTGPPPGTLLMMGAGT